MAFIVQYRYLNYQYYLQIILIYLKKFKLEKTYQNWPL